MFFNSFPGVLKNATFQPNELKFEALSGASLQRVVSFSYEGSIDSLTDEAEMIEIESFAIDFDANDLEKYCNEQATRLVTFDNCFKLLYKYPEQLVLNIIKRTCLNFIMTNFLAVSQRPEFIEMSPYLFEKMLRSKRIAVPEVDIFLAFMKWYCKNPNFAFTLETRNLAVQKRPYTFVILKRIRFPLIPVDVSIFLQNSFNFKI